MPPRRRALDSTAGRRPLAAATGGGGATIADLPDDLLVCCLAQLSQQDRFKNAALASKRFCRACQAPPLLREVGITVRSLTQLESLLEHLVKHAPHGTALSILSLPDDLLVCCLEPLSQQDRFRCVALLCKRFSRACLAPPLLRSIELSSHYGRPMRAARLEALLTLLLKHAAHVRSLRLSTGCIGRGADQTMPVLIASCLSACRLASAALVCKRFSRVCSTLPLDIRITPEQTSAVAQLWALHAFLFKRAPPMRSLHFCGSAGGAAGQEELAVLTACLGLCSVAGSGDALLAALEELDMSGLMVALEGPALPPAITRLCLEDAGSTQLPAQLLSLPSLARLELGCKRLEAGSLRVLAGLPSLTSLSTIIESPAFASLEATTQLQQLELWGDDFWGGGKAEGVQRLHTLGLRCHRLDRVPAGLASLPRLERLCLDCWTSQVSVEALVLPAGPWLASLRWLALPWCILQLSAADLRGAAALQHLSCFHLPMPGGEYAPLRAQWAGFWSCLESLPALRCLCIHSLGDTDAHPLPHSLSQALALLAGRCPALHWHLLRLPTISTDLLSMADLPAALSD
ncbi:hypothetical protein ABPG75_010586 [Micractinium tetrahymenae]